MVCDVSYRSIYLCLLDTCLASIKEELKTNAMSTTPRSDTPEMSGLCLNSNSSSLAKNDAIQADENKTESTMTEENNSKTGNNKNHYIVIKTAGASKDACGETSNSKENPMYMTLEHAACCLEHDCGKGNCNTLKQFFSHYNSCNKNSDGRCTICFALDAMVCQVRMHVLQMQNTNSLRCTRWKE